MLIGIDASRANRDHKSGTEWYSYYLIRWLAKLDDKNQYILYSDKPIKGGLLDLSTKVHYSYYVDKEIKYDKDGYQILRSPHKNFKGKILKWPYKNFWTLGRLTLEMIFHKPDILLVPAHSLPLFFPKKTINTIHDVAFARDKNLYEGRDDSDNKLLNFFVRLFSFGRYRATSFDHLCWSTKFAIKHAKKIIAVSNYTKKEIVDIFKCKPDKIEVIYNGYSRSWYKKIEDQRQIVNILNKYGIEQPYILYIGRLEKKKNTPNFIEAYALAKSSQKIKEKLVLIGDASFGYDEVKYAIREFGLDQDVVMPGWVAEDDIPFIYAGATAFVFPSKHEGFGIPVIQSMACEIPVATSDIPVLREVCQGAALFFDPRDICSMAKAIEKIILDQNLRKELIEKGRVRAADFSWEKTAKETLDLMNRL